MKCFRPSNETIQEALDMMKRYGLVHREATYNATADNDRRKEVTFRDQDLQQRLCRSPHEEVTVDAALEMLKDFGLIGPDTDYDRDRFERYREAVRNSFEGSWTSVTPIMERLMYMLTAVRRPSNLVELGCFWGNTLAWFVGPGVGEEREYAPDRMIGVDLDEPMIEQAKKNFAKLPYGKEVELISDDAGVALDRIDGPIDFLYLEAKDENNRNGYLDFLQQACDKLPTGAWVIAHDSIHWAHQKDMAPYLAWVRDRTNFTESISFEVDAYGLELSIK